MLMFFLIIFFFAGGYLFATYRNSNKLEKMSKDCEKDRAILQLLDRWFVQDIEGYKVSNFFADRNIKTIAIYGAGILGDLLYKKIEAENTGIKVKYVIDKDVRRSIRGLKTVAPGDFLADVDMVVVSAITAFNEIRNTMTDIDSSQILSLKDVICAE